MYPNNRIPIYIHTNTNSDERLDSFAVAKTSKLLGGAKMSERSNGGTYVCRRIKLYSYLTTHGFKPYSVVPDMYDTERVVWLYEDSDDIREAVSDYYAQD